AFHRSATKRISKAYYVLYNTMHSMFTQGVVTLLWGLLFGWEWALLALPIHLCGDRALFGNFLKPFGVTFEPVEHPAFARLRAVAGRPAVRHRCLGGDRRGGRRGPRRHGERLLPRVKGSGAGVGVPAPGERGAGPDPPARLLHRERAVQRAIGGGAALRQPVA